MREFLLDLRQGTDPTRMPSGIPLMGRRPIGHAT